MGIKDHAKPHLFIWEVHFLHCVFQLLPSVVRGIVGGGSGGDGKGEWRGCEGGVEGMGRGSGGDGKEDGVVSVSTKHCHIRIHMRRT